jgi:hypothetical protein
MLFDMSNTSIDQGIFIGYVLIRRDTNIILIRRTDQGIFV